MPSSTPRTWRFGSQAAIRSSCSSARTAAFPSRSTRRFLPGSRSGCRTVSSSASSPPPPAKAHPSTRGPASRSSAPSSPATVPLPAAATASSATAAAERSSHVASPPSPLHTGPHAPSGPASPAPRQRDPAPHQARTEPQGRLTMLEHTFHTPLPATLEVSILSGDIEVETGGGEETTLTIDGDERLLEDVEVRHDGGRVVVKLRGRKRVGFELSLGSLIFGNEGLRVQARVPHGAGVKVKTASADTQVAGHLRALDVDSASGDVRVRGEIAEAATVKTISGDVELERVDGDLSVQCVAGDIRARAVAGDVDTKSVSGDIRLEALTSGDVRFTSVSGDIEIGIAPGTMIDVDAGSTSGDLTSDVPIESEPLVGEEGQAPTGVDRGSTWR